MSSNLLPAFQKYIRATEDSAGNSADTTKAKRKLVRSPEYEEKAGFDPSQFRLSSAQLLEPTLTAINVGECAIELNQLSYFMDGIQRSWMLYYQNFTPVYYGYVAGVIRQRQEKILSTWKYDLDEAIYLPFNDFDPDELEQLKLNQFTLRDSSSYNSNPGDVDSEISAADPTLTKQPMAQRESAVKAITKQRERLEATLAKSWILENRNSSTWLVMDGSISISQITSEQKNIVGLIKSHNTQYFPFPDQEVIFNLKFGERSSLFQPKGRYPVCSWYLRVRDNTNQDLYFGLIRVEVSLKVQHLANQISQWILTERRPLALPDSRWDKMIYPIRDCEQLLRSREPSRASFGWLN
jgi:hypothetical protein